MPRKPSSKAANPAFREALGTYLRDARHRTGFSLREVERRSGVTDSEVFKVESGMQDCRLETFVRVCSALGIPWGEAVDAVLKIAPVPSPATPAPQP